MGKGSQGIYLFCQSKAAWWRLACLVVGVTSLSSIALGGNKSKSKPTVFGDPLPGLTVEQQEAFEEGLEEFSEVETPEEGLGPVFNARSCAECHAQPVVGGSSAELIVARETRFATRTLVARQTHFNKFFEKVFDPLEDLGGPVRQRQSVGGELTGCVVEPEEVPAKATLVSLRATTPLFGAGLMEAIPAATILKRADPDDRNHDGISGRANIVFNPETGRNEVGRFGWKAHVSTLHLFAGDAYLNEMGITSPTFPQENLPQGAAIDDACDPIPETDGVVEDDGEAVTAFAEFMRFLAPPTPRRSTSRKASGAKTFARIGCAECHVPTLLTGKNAVEALSSKPANLYSDLLLHDMGGDLEDGMEMGSAEGDEWRTTPLWGLGRRVFFLHDGRTTSIEDAIRAHGGEAKNARNRFLRLKSSERRALIDFLKTL